tara:strand:- start:31 stop:153 length:123 start_codon:yes stop_codon:yes gene_type:complete
MEKKEIITYKPKKSNIIKLEAYFKKITTDDQHKSRANIRD